MIRSSGAACLLHGLLSAARGIRTSRFRRGVSGMIRTRNICSRGFVLLQLEVQCQWTSETMQPNGCFLRPTLRAAQAAFSGLCRFTCLGEKSASINETKAWRAMKRRGLTSHYSTASKDHIPHVAEGLSLIALAVIDYVRNGFRRPGSSRTT